MKKVSFVILALLIVAGIYVYPGVSRTLYIATGFSAKNICSGHFISGFDAQKVQDEALVPVSPIFGLVDFDVNEAKLQITTTIIGLFERHAFYRKGTGCTLLVIGQEEIKTAIQPINYDSLNKKDIWPLGLAPVENYRADIDYPMLASAIDSAFEEPSTESFRQTKAVAVIYKGELIAERYAPDVDVETPLLSWSMAKSVTSLQVGMLVSQGKLDLYAAADVPQWQGEGDPRSKITLDQLMRMSSALDFNETYGVDTDVSRMLSIEGNAAAFASQKKLKSEPDSQWSYSSGTTNIIAAIVKRAIGGDFQQYYDYAQSQLFEPLGIHSAQLETDASDTFIGSSYFYASTRDWAKLGQLMLQNGLWNGKQILPDHWVGYSSTPTKTQPDNIYGAQFWLNADPQSPEKQRKWPSVPSDAYFMAGFQSQYVVMIPSEQLVVVRMGFTKPGEESGIEHLVSGVVAAIQH